MRAGRRAVLTSAVLVLISGSGAARAQSLAEVARQEAARRATVTAPSRVYTNADLTPDFTRPPEPPAPAGEVAVDPASATGGDANPHPAAEATEVTIAAEAAGSGADQQGVTPRDRQEPQPEDDKNEAFWRTRSQLIRSRVANQNEVTAGLRSRLEAFPPGTEGGEKAIVQQALQKAIADLTYLNDEWLRFERQARAGKIPDHWIR